MWEVGVIIAVVLVVDLLVIGLYKALKRNSHGQRLCEPKGSLRQLDKIISPESYEDEKK